MKIEVHSEPDVRTRTAKLYGRVTGFLGEHSKVGKSHAAGLILSCYPEENFVFRRRRASDEEAPKTVAAWLEWDPETD